MGLLGHVLEILSPHMALKYLEMAGKKGDHRSYLTMARMHLEAKGQYMETNFALAKKYATLAEKNGGLRFEARKILEVVKKMEVGEKRHLDQTTKSVFRCHVCGTPDSDDRKLKVCSRCKQVRYCSIKCQKKDWKKHKREGGDSSLTITRMNAGTARYCSPWNEPLLNEGAEEGYEKRDMYSFGLILLESLCKCKGSVVEKIPKLLQDYFIRNTRKYDDALWKKLKIADRVDIEFLKRVLEPDFKKRLSAQQALDYGYFGSPTQERKDAVPIVRKKNVDNIKMKIDALRTRSTEGGGNLGRLRLDVTLDRRVDGEGRRKSIVVPFLEKVAGNKRSLRNLLCDLHICFIGETGSDAGGVTRDALSLLFEQVCEEYCQEVGSTERAKFVMPSDQEDHSQVFYLLGVLCLRCFLENRSFKIPFPTFFYALLLNHPPRTSEDWIKLCLQCDPSFVSTLKESLYNPEMFKCMSEYGETFTTEGGRHEIALTESNKMEYMVFKIQSKLKGGTGGLNRLDKNFKAFKKGFYSLIEDDPLSLDIQHLLHPHELESIVFGDKSLPQEVLLANMVFKSGLVKRKEYLERYLSGTGEEDEKRRWDFLWFVTGSCDIVNKVLFKDCVPKKIEVVGTNDSSLRFKSSTCFYWLYVGDNYESVTFEKFSENVRNLIENAKIEGNLEDM